MINPIKSLTTTVIARHNQWVKNNLILAFAHVDHMPARMKLVAANETVQALRIPESPALLEAFTQSLSNSIRRPKWYKASFRAKAGGLLAGLTIWAGAQVQAEALTSQQAMHAMLNAYRNRKDLVALSEQLAAFDAVAEACESSSDQVIH